MLSENNEVFFQAGLVTSESLATTFTLPTAGTYTIGVFRISLVEPDLTRSAALRQQDNVPTQSAALRQQDNVPTQSAALRQQDNVPTVFQLQGSLTTN